MRALAANERITMAEHDDEDGRITIFSDSFESIDECREILLADVKSLREALDDEEDLSEAIQEVEEWFEESLSDDGDSAVLNLPLFDVDIHFQIISVE